MNIDFVRVVVSGIETPNTSRPQVTKMKSRLTEKKELNGVNKTSHNVCLIFYLFFLPLLLSGASRYTIPDHRKFEWSDGGGWNMSQHMQKWKKTRNSRQNRCIDWRHKNDDDKKRIWQRKANDCPPPTH